MTFIENLFPRHSAGLRELQPGFDTARSRSGAIMVTDSMQPSPSHFASWTIGNDRRVLDRQIALIIKAIGDPAANGVRRELARVHPDVEQMLVVILFGPHIPQPCQECF